MGQKPQIFTVSSLQPFKIKWNEFHWNIQIIQKNEEYVQFLSSI